MTNIIERQPHRTRLLVNFAAPIFAMLALFGLVAQRVDTNTSLARQAHTEAAQACNAIKASNAVTIDFLQSTIVPPASDPRHDEAQAFVDGLSRKYATAHTKCLAGS